MKDVQTVYVFDGNQNLHKPVNNLLSENKQYGWNYLLNQQGLYTIQVYDFSHCMYGNFWFN